MRHTDENTQCQSRGNQASRGKLLLEGRRSMENLHFFNFFTKSLWTRDRKKCMIRRWRGGISALERRFSSQDHYDSKFSD